MDKMMYHITLKLQLVQLLVTTIHVVLNPILIL